MKKHRLPLFLFSVLAILVIVAQWDQWKTSKENRQAEIEKRLFSNIADKISKIEFYQDSSDGSGLSRVLALELEGSDWRIVAPFATYADHHKVKSFVNN